MTMMEPLLVSDSDQDASLPSLGPAVVEESDFSRLISKTHPSLLQSAAATATSRFGGDFFHRDAQQQETPATTSAALTPRGPLYTIAAGTLCILHAGFLWGSYVADAWSETVVKWSIDNVTTAQLWQMLPQQTVVRSTSLASLLQDVATTENYLLLTILWVTALLVPCTFCILSPTWVVSDCQDNPVNMQQRLQTSWTARGLVELLVRFSLFTVFCLMILDVATSNIQLQIGTSVVIQICNRALGGLAGHVTALASAMGVLLVLRSPAVGKPLRGGAIHNYQQQPETPLLRSPPPQAFQHPWRLIDEPSMTVLEEEPQVPLLRPSTEASTPELIQETASVTAAFESCEPNNKKLTPRQRVMIFQIGLLTTVFWIPSLYLPLFRISYGGLAREFMLNSKHSQTTTVFLWQIPGLLWSGGIAVDTARWMLLGIGFVWLAVVLVLPVTACCLGIATWLGETELSKRCRGWLYCIHPALCGFVFSLALITTIPALQPLGDLWLDGSGICDTFQQVVGEPCLTLGGHLLPGAWFFLIQSMALETFVILSLRWT